MANESLILKIGADVSSLKGEFAKIDNQMGAFKNNVSKIGTTVSAVFGAVIASSVASSVVEMSKLAAESQGVEAAFSRLDNSAKLLDDLKRSTKGAVSELTLMKRAVAFNNFNLDLETLPKLLAFATARAQQTGQSVDYLVDSIVTGLGRKSLLILDNLGFSAANINAEVSKTGDFVKGVGNLVDLELAKMPPILNTSVDQANRLSASFENLKISIGKAINNSGFTNLIDFTSALLDPNRASTSDEIKKIVELREEAYKAYKKAKEDGDQKDVMRIAAQIAQMTAFIGDLKNKSIEYTAAAQAQGVELENIANLTAKLNDLQQMQQTLTGSALAKTNQEIEVINKKIKVLKELGTVQAANRRTEFANPVALSNPGTDPLMAGLDNFKSKIGSVVQPLQLAKTEMLSFQEAWAKLGYAGVDATAMINDGLANMTAGLGSAIGDLASGVGGMGDIGAVMLGAIGGMAIQLGQLAIASGVAVAGIKKALMSLNPAVAIAGGVALVALGKVVSNRAASIAKGGGGSAGIGEGASGSAGSRNGFITDQLGDRINLVGEFVLRGSNLVAAIDNQNRVDNRTKFG